jgi:hypothetical protein
VDVLHLYSLSIQVKGEATIEAAPNTPHFDDAHKLKLPAGHDGDEVNTTAANKENFPAALIQGYNNTFPHPPYYGPRHYPQPYYPQIPALPHMLAQYPLPPFPYNMYAGSSSAMPSPGPQLSPRRALQLGITLETFCDCYAISDTDQAKLAILEYRPGMPGVEKLNEQEWKELAGFSVLGWESIKDAHKQFLKDVRDGKWASL